MSTCGIKAVIATSFARIFYRNSVDGALLPIEIDDETYKKISHSDQLEINIEKNEIKNITKNEVYSMKPFRNNCKHYICRRFIQIQKVNIINGRYII